MIIRVTRKDVLWNYLGTFFSMFGNFLLLPFLVRYLTGSELGLWYVYIAVGNLVMLFEFGFNPTFARNFAFCWSGAKELTKEGCVRSDDDEVDPSLLAHLLAACRMVYRRITAVALVALVAPGTLYVLSVTGGLDRLDVLVSWCIYGAGVLLNLYYLYYAAMLRGIGSIAADNQIKITARLTQLVVTALLLYCGFGLVGATAGFLANSLIYRVLGYRKFWRNRDISKLNIGSIEISSKRKRELYQTISFNAYRDGAVQVANYASTQASSLICSSFLGLEQAGVFSIALQFATAIGNTALSYMNSFRPMMQSEYQRGDLASLRKALGRCMAVYVLLFFAMTVAVTALAYPLLNLFSPETSFDVYVFMGVSAYMLLFDWCALFSSMLCNMNSIPYVKAYVLSASAGIVLSIVLVTVMDLGAWGLVFGLAVPQAAYNNWKWPLEAARKLNTTVRSLLLEGMRSFIPNKKF